ncbi:MAG: hypothetical protein ACOX2Y_04850 [Christensenellales bacterium]
MKYLFLTLQYLFRLDSGKRFLALLLIALPPCILLAYFFPITGYFEWFFNYSGDYGSYSALWLSLAQRDSLGLGFLVLGYILLVLSVSAITTAVARSVRIGKFQLKNFLYLINENFFPSFYTITFFIIALMVAQVPNRSFPLFVAVPAYLNCKLCRINNICLNKSFIACLGLFGACPMATHYEHKRTKTP